MEDNAIKGINVLGKLFNQTSQFPQYKCLNFRDNPDLEKLQGVTYREHYEELKTKLGEPLGVYQRDLSDYDFEEYEFDNISKQEWEKLPSRPTEEINNLIDQIRKGNAAEAGNGIYHNKHFSTWGPEMLQQIEIPELVLSPAAIEEIEKNGK